MVYLAQAGLNTHWLMSGDGPMLLEGPAREAHADMVGAVTGYPAARRRHYGRVEESASRYVTDRRLRAETTVQGIVDATGWRPADVVVHVLEQMLYKGAMTDEAAAELVAAMKKAWGAKD